MHRVREVLAASNQMQMVFHHHIRVEAEGAAFLKIGQGIQSDSGTARVPKDGEPIHDGAGHEVREDVAHFVAMVGHTERT